MRSNKSFKDIKDIEKFLANYVPQNIGDNFFGEQGLARVKYFASLLGNPQEKIKVIHIAGTSGKGSTATILSIILQRLGLKTGLQVSPHLLDIRERCQINNNLLTTNKFIQYFSKIIPTIMTMKKSKFGTPTYFEIMTVLAFYIFWKEKVDYAIIETGLGGAWDASNIVRNKNKISILTKIGRDHTEILGKTLPEIAQQKAGIIQKENKVFSMNQKKSVQEIIKKICLFQKSALEYSDKKCAYKLGLKGEFQKENCSLALKVVKFLSSRDKFIISNNKIKKALQIIKFPGRFEVKNIKNKTVVFDGAHNTQKMKAFLASLQKQYPQKKFHFLIAFKKKKDYIKLLKQITKVATRITVTNIKNTKQDLGIIEENISRITKQLDELNYKNYNIVDDPKKVFKKNLLITRKEILVVTGSLYLISEIYTFLQNKDSEN